MALISPSERRNSSRFGTDLTLDLVLDNGNILPAVANNISEHGLQFSCDGWTANEIEPRGIHNHPLDHISLKLVARIKGDEKLYIKSRIISARRLSQDDYLIGLEFVDFENGSDNRLFGYLESISRK